MKKSFVLILALVGCSSLLLLVPYIFVSLEHTPQLLLDYNRVKGMATEHQDKLYTLNFEQQKKVMAILNQSVPMAATSVNEHFDFDRLIIYRFNQPDLDLYPINFDGTKLIFEIRGTATMIETGEGTFYKLLLQTFEPQ